MRKHFQVMVRIVVEANDPSDAQQKVDWVLEQLVCGENDIRDGQVGDVDEVRQTWERV
jgi:hypothetical protein